MPAGAVTVSVSTWGLPETSLTFDFEEFVKNELGLDLRGDNKKNSESGICKFYLRGGCSKGNSCPYQHSRGDRAVVCKHWLRGLCKKGDMCEFLHEYNLKKMPECWFYSKYGDCSNGDECLYLHIDPESKIRECPWYARGFCKQGPECRHKHVRKVVCQLYLTGFCPHGPTCSNGHPKWELAEAEEEEEISRSAVAISLVLPVSPRTKQQPRRNISDIVCFKCGQKGHYANRCPNV